MALALAAAALTAWSAAVLIGGPIGAGPPRLEAALTALAAGALVLLASARSPTRWEAARSLLAVLPFAGLAAAMYLSPGLNHLIAVTGELGWLLTAAMPAAVHAVAPTGTRSHWPRDLAFGGAVGLACAVLISVAVADGRFESWAALAGWAGGAATLAALVRLPPRPAVRIRGAIALRALPAATVWAVALAAATPSAVRHELASSAAAQVLAVLLAMFLLLGVGLAWAAERGATTLGVGSALRGRFEAAAGPVVVAVLLGVGALQAASYSAITIDDLGRYWSIADSLANGLGYDVWGGGPRQAMGPDPWMDLPGLPALMVVSFALFGHSMPAALVPMFLANLLLPAALFLAVRALGVGRAIAFGSAVVAVLAPPIQIYFLGAAEPDAVFALALTLAVALFVHVVRGSPTRGAYLGLGVMAAVVAMIRPEGPVYGAALLAAAVLAQRNRRSLAAVGAALVLVAPFVLLSLAQVGRVWPQQAQGLSAVNLIENVRIVRDSVWPWTARVLLLDDLRFPLLMGLLAALFAIGSVALGRRSLALLALPVAVLLNLGITLGIDATPLGVSMPPELIRHLAPAFPVVTVVAALGADSVARALRRRPSIRLLARPAALGVAAYVIAGSLYLLSTPEEYYHGNRSGSLLRGEIYVNAPELWQTRVELPCPPCLAENWDFLAFRGELFAAYAPHDAHSNSDGAAYQTLSGALVALGLSAGLVARGQSRDVRLDG